VDATQTAALEVSPQQRRLQHLAVVRRHLVVLCRAVKVLVLVVHHAVLLLSRVMTHRVQRLAARRHFLVVVAVKHHVVTHLLRRVSVENKWKAVKQCVNC
jgi:hypothetical protein